MTTDSFSIRNGLRPDRVGLREVLEDVGLPPDDEIETHLIREVLDGLATRLAVERSSPEDFAILVSSVELWTEEMQHASERGDLGAVTEYNGLIHQALREASASPRLLQMVSSLNVPHRWNTLLVPGRAQEAVAEHLAILEALRRRDANAIEAAMRDHHEHALAALMNSSRVLSTMNAVSVE